MTEEHLERWEKHRRNTLYVSFSPGRALSPWLTHVTLSLEVPSPATLLSHGPGLGGTFSFRAAPRLPDMSSSELLMPGRESERIFNFQSNVQKHRLH